ncbi:MAG: type II toxin-antitoxin system YafQ family toxin [Treponemataceae bacterium]|nr:MAG: type II toxin-antitoxin system YafQ family toxin [Treponemataceae bacterium]
MLEPTFTGLFRKELKLMEKRGKNLSKIEMVTTLIINEQPLSEHYRNHLLHGKKYDGKWECHVEPDWLLVYAIDSLAKKVVFHRTGTHSDSFK